MGCGWPRAVPGYVALRAFGADGKAHLILSQEITGSSPVTPTLGDGLPGSKGHWSCWKAHLTFTQEIIGSSPICPTQPCSSSPVEHRPDKTVVPGSTPGAGTQGN